ncbi:MAG: 4,5-DOPA dioxygenase extradiol [Anaerolineae bacterium]|nr:MAG: 4,5-DOPA dioxygenase extradiol [Anaerolineae bacterium]
MATKMPVLFVGHGNPMNAIEENDFSKAWIEEGRKLPQPRAILCVSAHWVTRGTLVTAMDKPRTIYDMYGFPPELYEVRYDAPGAPDLAGQIRRIIKTTEVRDDFEWGLDHGTVIGSGNIVHNLRLARLEDSAYDWAVEFDQRVKNWIEQNDHDPIVHFERGDQAAALAINSAEHYVPLLYSLALRDESDPISFFADKVIGGSISMRSVKIG